MTYDPNATQPIPRITYSMPDGPEAHQHVLDPGMAPYAIGSLVMGSEQRIAPPTFDDVRPQVAPASNPTAVTEQWPPRPQQPQSPVQAPQAPNTPPVTEPWPPRPTQSPTPAPTTSTYVPGSLANRLAARHLRRPDEVLAEWAEQAPKLPTAQELSERYAPTAAETQWYGRFLKKSSMNMLDFDPTENIRAFARSVDARNPQTGRTEMVINIDPRTETDLAHLSERTSMMMVQQLRLARTLGFTTPEPMRIENGQLKYPVIAPNANTPSYAPVKRGGQVLDYAKVRDPNGTEIDSEVMESLYAANEFMYLQGVGALNLQHEITSIIDQAKTGEILIRLNDGYYHGGISFTRNLAAALGYKVDDFPPTTPADERARGTHYAIPVRRKRPGWRNAMAPGNR